MVNWRTDWTQCDARKKDGTRCKIGSDPIYRPEELLEPGVYLCEHHRYDLDSFIKGPLEVTEMYKRYFPKNHHPACDRKGQNDCDCPDRHEGVLLGLTLKRSCETSLEMALPHKRWKRLEMRKRTRLIREHYNSITEDDLWLPPKSNWRQFRFFMWCEEEQRLVVRKVKDCIKHKHTLLKWLRNLAPHHVYYTTSKWTNAQAVGPDPYSKSGKGRYKKRFGLLKWTYDQWIGQEMFFDVDYEMPSFKESAEETKRLADYYRTIDFRDCDKQLMFVFSGGKGFHMIDWGFDCISAFGKDFWMEAVDNRRKKDTTPSERHTSGVRSYSYGVRTLSKEMKQRLIKQIRSKGILLDYEVTVDPRRIIRLPGTIHGKRGRVCRIIDETELNDFKPGPALW